MCDPECVPWYATPCLSIPYLVPQDSFTYADASEKITRVVRRAVLIHTERKAKNGCGTSTKEGSVALYDLQKDAELFSVVDKLHRIVSEQVVLAMVDKIWAVLPHAIAIPMIALDNPCYVAFIVGWVYTGHYTLTDIIIRQRDQQGVLIYSPRTAIISGTKTTPTPSMFLVPMSPVETRDFYRFPDCAKICLNRTYESAVKYGPAQRCALVDKLCTGTLGMTYCLIVEEKSSVCLQANPEGLRFSEFATAFK